MGEIKAYGRPRQLYRYRSLGNEIDNPTLRQEIEAITGRYIFCPLYSEMNDPMEGSHRESALLKGDRRRDEVIREVRQAMGTYGIASLSETNTHEPMWAYYSGSFKGLCVEYSVPRLLSGLPNNCELVRMTYSEEAPMLLRNAQSTDDRAKMVLSCKSLRWAGEREWRLIRPSRGQARYRETRTVLGVYLGSRISRLHERIIREEMEKVKIKVFKMKVDAYALGFDGPPKSPIKRKAAV